MGYFYFAGNSLASMRATRDLAVRHNLIWRRPAQLPALVDGDRILLAFWPDPLVEKRFIPLAVFEAAASRRPTKQGPCYTTIPRDSLGEFLTAERGVGGTGYRTQDNPTHMAISVRRVPCPELDGSWDSSRAPLFYGFDRPANGRRAFWRLDEGRLLAMPNRLPRRMWPE